MSPRVIGISLCFTIASCAASSHPEQDTNVPAPPNQAVAPEPDEVSDMNPAVLAQFREPLSPYGQWMDDPTYGTVWVPSPEIVGADFVPYETGGRWSLTVDNDWIWVSEFDWGWAPFHYGRWLWIDGTGWGWIAGGVYAPAWVGWRVGSFDAGWYVGWSPLPPVWYWRGGIAVRFAVPPAAARFVLVSSEHVFDPYFRSYVVPGARMNLVLAQTRPLVAAPGAHYRAFAEARAMTIAQSHVPAHAVPAERVAHDPRALAFQQRQHAGPSPSKRAPARVPDRSVREGNPHGDGPHDGRRR